MANLLILGFYNTDFGKRIFLRILYAGIYVVNLQYRILKNIYNFKFDTENSQPKIHVVKAKNQ